MFSPTEETHPGWQPARLEWAKRLTAEIPGAFLPNQYANQANPEAHYDHNDETVTIAPGPGGAPARHQSVQVGPPDQGGRGPQRDGRDDVAAIGDTGVHEHLGPSTQRLHGGLHQLQRYGSAVELSTAVVGQQDAVRARVHHAEGVVDALHSLDHELAGPGVAEPLDIGHRQCGIERPD